MYTKSRQYFKQVPGRLAAESAALLLPMGCGEKKAFLSDTSTKQLRRILPLSAQPGDVQSCRLIDELVRARGYHNEL